MPPRTLATLAHALSVAPDLDATLLALGDALSEVDRFAKVARATIRAADGGASRIWPARSQAGGLIALCSRVLTVIRAAGASAIGGKEPRDIRVVLVGPVPGHAFLANEVARRGGLRTVIDA